MDRVGKARRLRESGIALSDVVREAIDERFATLAASQRSRDARAVVAQLLERHPDPPDVGRRSRFGGAGGS